MFRNFRYKLFAFGLAVIFWVFVVSLQNSFAEFPQTVPIQAFNLGEKLAVSEIPEGVRLTLRAESSEIFRRLQQSDFEAYVDLSDVGIGKKKMPVKVTSKNPKVSVARIDPEEIFVKIEAVREKTVLLKVKSQGEPSAGFEIKSLQFDVSSVKISGAESVLQNVGEALALVSFDGSENKNFTRKVPVKIFDASGLPIEKLSVNPNDASISVELFEKEKQKQVGVKVNVKGALASGFVKALTVEPQIVTVIGENAVVSGISFVETEPLLLSSITESTEKRLKLKLPAGVSVLNKEDEFVKVKIEIEKLSQ